ISCCWSTPRSSSVIILDDRLVHVPKSPVAALRRMQLSDQPRILWIDAICINQPSESKKSERMAFMATIYISATRNLVHLGE
ncbi:heterokaryon incompatibility, partial [Ampelomyces quisqualis]